jgi:hypothetical protein
MKTLILLFFFLSFINAFASSTNSIVDIYLDLPSDYLQLTHDSNGKPYTKNERLKAIKVKDIKNGYLHIKDPDSIGEYTLAVFRLKQGGSIVALVTSGESVETFKILQKDKDVWKDASATYLPTMSDTFLLSSYEKSFPTDKRFKNLDYLKGYAQSVVRYKLPQKGTTIEAYAGIDEAGIYGKPLFFLDFDRTKFLIKK